MLKVKQFVTGALSSNTYLVYKDGAKQAVLIDTFRGKEKILAYTQSLGLEIVALLITHGHFDHIYEAAYWQSMGAKIYIHEADAHMLYGRGNLGGDFGIAVQPCKADYLLNDGDKIDVAGIQFAVMHTPGHSKGSCCYLAEDCLFSGDTLFEGTVGRTDFEGGSLAELKKSIIKLFSLQGDYIVYPGHEQTTTLGNERVQNMIVAEL